MYLDGGGLWDLGTQDCKNLQHGHAGYGQWMQGFLQWLSEVKVESRKARPGAVYAGEGLSDAAFQYLDLSLFYPDNAPQVYLYSMPGNYGVIHGAEFSFFKDWPAGYMEFASVYGLKFGGADWTFENDLQRARKVFAFRQKISQFQFRSRFMDDQGLDYDDPEIKAKLFVRNETGTRGAMVVAYNPKLKDLQLVSGKQHTYAVHDPGPVLAVTADLTASRFVCDALNEVKDANEVEAGPGRYCYDAAAAKLCVRYREADPLQEHSLYVLRDQTGLAISGAHVTVEGINFSRFSLAGVTVGGAEGSVLRRSKFSYCGYPWGAAVSMYQARSFTTEDCAIWTVMNGFLIQDCTASRFLHISLFRSRAHGFILNQCRDNAIRNNIIYAGGPSGAAL